VLSLGLACQCGWLIPWPPADPLCAEAPFLAPNPEFDEFDLVGVWEARYGSRVDTLILKDDGTFKQVYRDPTAEDYVYETAWNKWWLERFPDGRVRMHLPGGRYYIDGVTIAELDGYAYGGPSGNRESTPEAGALPYPFYDPFGKERLHMIGELVLTVRVDSSGELLLHHMTYSSEEGFAMIGCQRSHFRRLETP
ncbi:MAG: hypothetical protein WBB22_03735, partial [Anaerolineae bacterium]